jgi:hypothetical protein
MALFDLPRAAVDLARTAVGQVIETAATLVTVPARMFAVLSQAELLVARIGVVAEQAEAMVERAGQSAEEAATAIREIRTITSAAAQLMAEAEHVATGAQRLIIEGDNVAIGAAKVVGSAAAATDAATSIITDAAATTGAASAVVVRAAKATEEAEGLLHAYTPTLRKAAPLAERFVNELSPEEISAAISMVDTFPELRRHLVDDVLPLLGKLDQVGPDLHKLLEVTEDLQLAIAGLPGLRMLKRRGEEREQAEERAANGR